MQKTSIVIIVLILITAFFGYRYVTIAKELRETKKVLAAQESNERILAFTSLFIEKVLKAEGEIDFETRLQLENAVRNLGDKEVMDQWTKFVDSKTEQAAQDSVKNLLALLTAKVQVK